MTSAEISIEISVLDFPRHLGGAQLVATIMHGQEPHGSSRSIPHLAAARQMQLVSGIHRVRLTAAAVALVRTFTGGVFSLPAWEGWEAPAA